MSETTTPKPEVPERPPLVREDKPPVHSGRHARVRQRIRRR